MTVYLDLARALPQPRCVGPGCVHTVMGAAAARVAGEPLESVSSTGIIQHISRSVTDLRSREISTEACGFGGWLVCF